MNVRSRHPHMPAVHLDWPPLWFCKDWPTVLLCGAVVPTHAFDDHHDLLYRSCRQTRFFFICFVSSSLLTAAAAMGSKMPNGSPSRWPTHAYWFWLPTWMDGKAAAQKHQRVVSTGCKELLAICSPVCTGEERERGWKSESAASDLFVQAGELFVRCDLQMQTWGGKKCSSYFVLVFFCFLFWSCTLLIYYWIPPAARRLQQMSGCHLSRCHSRLVETELKDGATIVTRQQRGQQGRGVAVL